MKKLALMMGVGTFCLASYCAGQNVPASSQNAARQQSQFNSQQTQQYQKSQQFNSQQTQQHAHQQGHQQALSIDEDVNGEIIEVNVIPDPRRKGEGGVHLFVKTEKGEQIPVHIGPTWYLTQQKFGFKAKDKIEIIGDRININGHDVIIAFAIKQGGRTLKLRNEEGLPLWTKQGGWGKR